MEREEATAPPRCPVCGTEVEIDAGHYRILDVRVHSGCIRLFWCPPPGPREINGGSARFRSPSFEATVEAHAEFRARWAAIRVHNLGTRATSCALLARSVRVRRERELVSRGT